MTAIRFALACVLFAGAARADTLSEVKAHEAVFARACEAGDVPAVVALFADDAVVVWPGAGAEAKGKAAIERLVVARCSRRAPPPALRSVETRPLDDTHISVYAHWEETDAAGVATDVRATQVLVRKGDGRWLYVVDHASVGVPRAKP